MRVLGIERDETACNYYRILMPLSKLREHGLADTLIIHERELASEYALEKVLEADIIIFQRPANDDWFNFIKLCRKNGKIIVSDYDDDPFNTSPLNPYYRFIGVKGYQYKWPSGEIDVLWKDGENGFDIERNIMRRDMFVASFKRSDMVTCTTDILKDTLNYMNKNVRVLPNLIDLNLYSRPEFQKKEFRIGYQCGASHYEDLYMVRPAIEEICRKHPQVKFVYFGDYRFRKLFQNIPTRQFEFHDWVRHIAYPYKLSLLNLDLGICPLVDNPFNRNKSAIKFFEYTAVGAATIASNIPPYQGVIRDGETGILVDDQHWVDAIEVAMIPEFREKFLDNAFEDVRDNWSIDKKIHLWRDAYESLINQEVQV